MRRRHCRQRTAADSGWIQTWVPVKQRKCWMWPPAIQRIHPLRCPLEVVRITRCCALPRLAATHTSHLRAHRIKRGPPPRALRTWRAHPRCPCRAQRVLAPVRTLTRRRPPLPRQRRARGQPPALLLPPRTLHTVSPRALCWWGSARMKHSADTAGTRILLPLLLRQYALRTRTRVREYCCCAVRQWSTALPHRGQQAEVVRWRKPHRRLPRRRRCRRKLFVLAAKARAANFSLK
jgi:hypothetical protein